MKGARRLTQHRILTAYPGYGESRCFLCSHCLTTTIRPGFKTSQRSQATMAAVVELEVDEYRYDEDLGTWVLVEEPTLTDDPRTRREVHQRRSLRGWDLVTCDETVPGVVRDLWQR